MNKFVLSLDLLKEFDESSLFDMVNKVSFIDQGYIGDSVRIRRLRTVNIQKYRNSEVNHWDFTFDQIVGSETITIHQELDSKSGADLLSICDRKLSKTRYCFPKNGDLDLFRAENDYVYFIVFSGNLPEFLTKFIFYKTILTDARFLNRNLASVRYAMNLYQKIERGDVDNEEEV